MSVEITMEEWLSELNRLSEAAPASDDRAMTAEEIAQSLGRSAWFVRARILGPGVRSGRIAATKKTIMMISGFAKNVPAYRVVGPEKPAKRGAKGK